MILNRQMDKSRQYFKTWHLTHEDHCLAGDRISKLLDKMKTDCGMESVSLLTELCTLQPAPAEKRRWCKIVPLGENSLQFCTYWRDADIFSTEYFTYIHYPLHVDWLMYQWSLCTERWQRDKQRILFIRLCSPATQFFIMSKQQCLKPCFYGEVMIHSPFSWLTLLSLAWGHHVFIYLFI